MPMPSAAQIAKMTPMLQQYFQLKTQCGEDTVLFFRMGDFYEIFGEDAAEVAPKLEIVLTAREKGDQEKIPFCGVPHHSARNYWLRLLKMGIKVAIADQIEDPKLAKGLVKRDITRILTPACIDDLEGLEEDLPNYLMAAYEDPKEGAWAVLIADISTGELRLGNIKELSDLIQVVEQIKPKEILGRRFYQERLKEVLAPYSVHQKLLFAELPEAPLRDAEEQKNLLRDFFASSSLESLPCGIVSGGLELVCATFAYLKSLQAPLQQFLTVHPLSEPKSLALSESVVRNLELFETAHRRESEGSLYREIAHTLSPMGSRLLRFALANPLRDKEAIKSRHASVGFFKELGEETLQDLRRQLKGTPDLERIVTRIIGGSVHPAELALVRESLERAKWALDLLDRHSIDLSPLLKSIKENLKQFSAPYDVLLPALQEIPGALGSGTQVFKKGFDPDLDEKIRHSEAGESEITAYESSLKERTKITSLKIKGHKTFGYLIEITKANLTKVPTDFIRRQTMVNCERFVTVELQELGETLAGALEGAVQRETELYQALLQRLILHKSAMRSVAKAFAMLDMLQSFAWLAIKHGYTEASLNEGGRLSLKASRHPVVERFVGGHSFIPNDVEIDPAQKMILITGPNMAGKSTVMRQTAIAAILNQIGSYVPAEKAELPIFDQIFTRVGAADDLSRGQSTFMVEMSEAAAILRRATSQSLVILDEVGRGTSTQDGLAIASAILCDLAVRLKSYTLFATHYHELVPLSETLAEVATFQTEVVEKNGKVHFTHRLIKGSSGNSFGLEVAKIAGLPDHVLKQAETFLAKSAATSSSTRKGAESKPPAPLPLESGGLISEPVSKISKAPESLFLVKEALDRVNIHKLTPLQALNILNDLKDLVVKKSEPASLWS